MKPLMSVKVRRGRKLDEWESSEQQATLDGLQSFAQRQEARRQIAQGKPVSDVSNVREILPVVRRRKP